MSHTPGPWKTDGYQEDGVEIGISGSNPTEDWVATVLNDVGGWSEYNRTEEVVTANARLIAAAPDLLAFAEHVVDYCNDPHVVAAAKEAVAKARGESA